MVSVVMPHRLLNLRRIREQRFLTQDQLAELVKTSKANISRLENGHQMPRASTILELAKALNVKPEELVEWVEDDHQKEGNPLR